MRIQTLILLAGTLVLGDACGKHRTDISTSAPGAEPTPDSAAVQDPGQTAALLAELTQAVRKYSAETRRVPKSLDDLVSQGYLTKVPLAPPGKRFAIDKTLHVYLAND
jgi:hypothetical protein